MKMKITLIKWFIPLLLFVGLSNAFGGSVTFSVGSATNVNNGTTGATFTAFGRYYLEQVGIGKLYRQTTAASSITAQLTPSSICDAGGSYMVTTNSTIVLNGVSTSSKYVHIFYSDTYDVTGIQINNIATTAGRTITGIYTFTATGTFPNVTGNFLPFSTVTLSGSTSTSTVCSAISFTCTGVTYIPKGTFIAIVESGSGVQPSSLTITTKDAGPTVALTSGSATQSGLGTVAITPIVYTSTNTTNAPTITWGTNGIPSGVSVATDPVAQTVTISGTPANVASTTVYDYTVTVASGNTLNGSITVTPYVTPAPSFSTPANTTQALKANVAISNIVYNISNSTDATVTGLPTGVTGSYSGGVFTISGTPGTETTYPAVYTYTVTATPLVGYVGAPVTATGIITVKNPAIKSILYLTTIATATDPFYTALSLKYDMTARAAQASFTGNYNAYDLIVLHESLNGADAGVAGNELNLIKSVDKPILNTKSYFYSTGRWGWGTPSNGDNRAAVTVKQSTHPIFTGVPIVGDSVVMLTSYVAKNIQPTTITVGGFAIATTSSASNVAIHEIPAATRSVSASSKYLMVSLLSTQFVNLSPNALKILDNAVTYLLGPTTFTPVYSSDATLSSITLNGTALTGFASTTTTYNVVLPYGTTVVPVVAATTTATVATKVITQATALPGTATIVVTAEDLSTKTYTINFTVAAASADATLSNLTTSVGTLNPSFSSGTTSYAVELPYGTTTVPTVTPTVNESHATKAISYPSSLPGATTVTVTAQDGTTTTTYTVNYTVAKNSDATLTGLTVSAGTLTPAFDAATTAYSVELPVGSTVYPTITATPATGATEVTTTTAFPGTATIVVTAEDSVTTKTYTISFTVAKSTDATLTGLTVGAGTLTPAFDAATTAYSVELPEGSSAYPTITATPATGATQVTTTTAFPGTATIVVTAEDGITTKTYTISFTVTPPVLSTDASLVGLAVGAGTLSPAFDAATTSYSVALPTGSTAYPTITPTPATGATQVTTTTAFPGTATIVVTAEDGVTTKTYTISFTVTPPVLSSDASLTDLTVSEGTLTPAFAAATTGYSVELPSGSTAYPTITPTPATGATVNTTTTAFPGIVTIVVTAEDGVTTKTYTISFTVTPPVLSSDASLTGLTVSEGTLTPAFAAATTSYSVELPSGSTAYPTITPTPATGATVNTTTTAFPGIVTIVVTAEDGVTTKTYTISFTVTPPVLSTDASLTGLAVSVGTLSPAFDAATTSYSVELPSGSTVYPTVTPTTATGATVVTTTTAFPGTVTTVVTAEDGVTTKTYTINFTVATATGISDASSVANVYTTASSIIVEGGINAKVSVVSVSGNIIYSGVITSGKETLPVSLKTGVYIILVNGVSTKVIVK